MLVSYTTCHSRRLCTVVTRLLYSKSNSQADAASRKPGLYLNVPNRKAQLQAKYTLIVGHSNLEVLLDKEQFYLG